MVIIHDHSPDVHGHTDHHRLTITFHHTILYTHPLTHTHTLHGPSHNPTAHYIYMCNETHREHTPHTPHHTLQQTHYHRHKVLYRLAQPYITGFQIAYSITPGLYCLVPPHMVTHIMKPIHQRTSSLNAIALTQVSHCPRTYHKGLVDTVAQSHSSLDTVIHAPLQYIWA